jgi:ribosomal protein L10
MAKERFLSLIENRPEIMANVPLKVIASYLGVTPTYLSRLRKEYFEKK